MNGALRIIRVCRAITPNRTEPSIAPTRKGMNPCGFGISRRDIYASVRYLTVEPDAHMPEDLAEFSRRQVGDTDAASLTVLQWTED